MSNREAESEFLKIKTEREKPPENIALTLKHFGLQALQTNREDRTCKTMNVTKI